MSVRFPTKKTVPQYLRMLADSLEKSGIEIINATFEVTPFYQPLTIGVDTSTHSNMTVFSVEWKHK